jgi:ubiquinone/menaquinone biosynthesis C-methylase UbiE
LELNDHVFACGADIDEAALRHGKELAPGIHFVCTEGERLPLHDLSFDVVTSRVALPLMHLPKALAEIARVVKPRRADLVLSPSLVNGVRWAHSGHPVNQSEKHLVQTLCHR